MLKGIGAIPNLESLNVQSRAMYEITLENYRCFRRQQTARLAPVTLLVGENSTGKTSFMSMVQVLLDITCNNIPDFKKIPYDLGSFDEIAHHRGGRGGRAESFRASICMHGFKNRCRRRYSKKHAVRFDVKFGRGPSSAPVQVYRRLSYMDTYIEEQFNDTPPNVCVRFGTSKNSWQTTLSSELSPLFDDESNSHWRCMSVFHRPLLHIHDLSSCKSFEILEGDEEPTVDDLQKFNSLANSFGLYSVKVGTTFFASAPVRSKPSRTYDPARHNRDPEGDYIPKHLANLYFQSRNDWKCLQKNLIEFGQNSGLFDEISIKKLGKKESEPFQLQIRKFGTRAKGPKRNLIDVGYGVSQVLPIITELSRKRASYVNLLQQPEVHLHPSAQAALGSFFCQIASPDRNLIVETHSDYILDRVRMDVRDRTSKLKPEDVSILFFERKNLGVKIHSLRIDNQGNILNAPEGYRKFFMEETRRSLGL